MTLNNFSSDLYLYILSDYLSIKDKVNLLNTNNYHYNLVNRELQRKFNISSKNISKIVCKSCNNVDYISTDFPGYCSKCF